MIGQESLHLQLSENIHWAKQIQELLMLYDINDSWEQIRNMPFAEWKRKVNGTIESKHHQRLKEGFDGALCEKQKTKSMKNIIEGEHYERKPLEYILNRSKTGARALIMGR